MPNSTALTATTLGSNAMAGSIPSEVYLPWLNRTIEIHWNYHAYLMTVVWLVLVPVAILVLRFFKTKPTPNGIPKGTSNFDPKLLCWTIHLMVLYPAIGLSLLGMVVALVVSGGFSASLHAIFGISTIVFGCMQVISAWFRGTHGGERGVNGVPNDPSTWRGDHYDMTPRRRWFESYHKTAGYFTLILALAAMATGLAQFWMPAIGVALGVVLLVILALSVFLEGKGFRHDTYRSVYGNLPDHPYNKAREGL